MKKPAYICKHKIMCVDDEQTNLDALRVTLKSALALILQKEISLIDDILHEATFGQ